MKENSSKKLTMKDLVGRTIGKLLITDEFRIHDKTRHLEYKCICECGNYRYCTPSDIKRKHYKSCGNCLRKKFNIEDYKGKKIWKIKNIRFF